MILDENNTKGWLEDFESFILTMSYDCTKTLPWDYVLNYIGVGRRQIYLMAEVILNRVVEVGKLQTILSTSWKYNLRKGILSCV